LVIGLFGFGWWMLSRDEATSGEDAAVEQGSAQRRAALVERKAAARAAAGVVLDPVSVTGLVAAAADGSPIAGAIVLLSPKGLEGGQAPEPGTRPQPLVARTDADGAWRIDGVRPGRFTLSASAEGYLPAALRSIELGSGHEGAPLRLALASGGHLLHGQVTDIGGGPVEGAVVSVVRLDEGNLLDFSRAPSAALTDDDGRFRLHLPNGLYTAAVQHADYKDGQESVEIAGGPRRLDVSLVPGSMVEGVVRVRGTDAPVASALVAWQSSSMGAGSGFALAGFGEGRVFTDEQGRFRVRGLGSGVFAFHAVADGLATRQAVEVALGVADHTDEVVLYVDTAYKVSGFVVRRDDEERGLEGVLLGALSMSPPGLVVAKSPSEHDGYFEILGVQPGNYMIGAIGEEALPNLTGTSAQVSDRDVTDVLVMMDPGARVRGRVQPAGAATISVMFEPEGGSLSGIMSSITNAFVRARSDAEDGTFELHPVSPGKLKLVAEGDDGSKGELLVDVTADGADGVTIVLEPRPVLAGRVVDARGNPVGDAHVYAQAVEKKEGISFKMTANGMNMFGEGAPTREDGSFLIAGVDPGRHTVQVKVANGQQSLAWAVPADVDDPSKPLEIEVTAAGRHDLDLRVEARNGVIEGVVTAADGPAADAWVRAIRHGAAKELLQSMQAQQGAPAGNGAHEADEPGAEVEAALSEIGATKPVLTDETGRFRISGLRAGTYTVVAEGDRGGSRGRVEGVDSQARVTVRLEPLAGLEGRVTAKGAKVERYEIALKGKSSRTTHIYDPEGFYRVTRLDPGTYEVSVDSELGVATDEIEVVAGTTARLDIALDPFGRLRGKVVDQAAGEPIANLAVMVEAEGRGANQAAAFSMLFGQGPRTDATGRFDLDRVPPGSGKLQLMDRDAIDGGAVATVRYTVRPGETLDLGTVTGIRASTIPADERGELGLATTVATWTARPQGDPEADDARPPADSERPRLWISSVTPGGAAAEAGVRPGDEVVAIDGRDVAGLGPDTARRLLSPTHVRAGKDVAVEIQRDASRERHSLRARPKGAG
jgi:protocatechuate 3,4-dioxygenase beta subunit